MNFDDSTDMPSSFGNDSKPKVPSTAHGEGWMVTLYHDGDTHEAGIVVAAVREATGLSEQAVVRAVDQAQQCGYSHLMITGKVKASRICRILDEMGLSVELSKR